MDWKEGKRVGSYSNYLSTKRQRKVRKQFQRKLLASRTIVYSIENTDPGILLDYFKSIHCIWGGGGGIHMFSIFFVLEAETHMRVKEWKRKQSKRK